MTKQEILARLKPVLSAELYSAIEAVFVNEDGLQKTMSVLKEAFKATEKQTPDSATKYAAFYQDARDVKDVQDWTQR